MLSAFLISLREGVEASLVVGIILVYLSRTGRQNLAKFVWYGVAAAAALSLAVAVALERWQISQDGFEGLLLLVAAFFVVTMIIWMNRVARHLKKDIEQKVEAYAARAGLRCSVDVPNLLTVGQHPLSSCWLNEPVNTEALRVA